MIQLLLPVPWLRGLDGRLQLVLDWRDPAVRRFFVLMLPVTLTLGLINVSAVIDTLFASRLIDPDLAPAAINAAFRLYMLPQGMFSVAVATVLFPALARLAARNDLDGFRATVSTGLRQIGFLLIPASVVSAVLAEPIVRLVYERGAFTESRRDRRRRLPRGVLARPRLQRLDADADARLLRAAVELAADGDRASARSCSTPCSTSPSTGSASGGSRSRPRSSTSSASAFLVFFLRRRVGGIDLARVADAVVRITIASAVLGAVAFASGTGSTARSAARSRRRSCRSAPRSPSVAPCTSAPAGCSACASSTRCAQTISRRSRLRGPAAATGRARLAPDDFARPRRRAPRAGGAVSTPPSTTA